MGKHNEATGGQRDSRCSFVYLCVSCFCYWIYLQACRRSESSDHTASTCLTLWKTKKSHVIAKKVASSRPAESFSWLVAVFYRKCFGFFKWDHSKLYTITYYDIICTVKHLGGGNAPSEDATCNLQPCEIVCCMKRPSPSESTTVIHLNKAKREIVSHNSTSSCKSLSNSGLSGWGWRFVFVRPMQLMMDNNVEYYSVQRVQLGNGHKACGLFKSPPGKPCIDLPIRGTWELPGRRPPRQRTEPSYREGIS